MSEERVEDDGDGVGDRHGDREVRVEHLLQLSLFLRHLVIHCGRRVPVGRDIPGSIHSLSYIRDLGFMRLVASLIIFKILTVFIPNFFHLK